MGCRALVIGMSSARHRRERRHWGASVRPGAVGRHALNGDEDRVKFVDTFRRLRNARFPWICSGGLPTAVLGR